MSGISAVVAYCGWHIAPSISETLQVEGDGGRVLLLPSLHVTNVTEVRDESGNVVTGWKARRNGVLRGCWKAEELYEVDVTHGYDAMPDEVEEIIAKLDAEGIGVGAVRVTVSGPFSQTYDLSSQPITVRSVLDRYKLPPRP